jgi:hypothetical protein
VQGLYVLGVVTASAVAAYSAIVVGIEKDRRQRRQRARPELFLVQTSGNPTRSPSFERALNTELRRRARRGAHRHSSSN